MILPENTEEDRLKQLRAWVVDVKEFIAEEPNMRYTAAFLEDHCDAIEFLLGVIDRLTAKQEGNHP